MEWGDFWRMIFQIGIILVILFVVAAAVYAIVVSIKDDLKRGKDD